MKRFYTLALGLMMGATTLFAQKTTDLQFVTITGEGDEAVETGTIKDGAAIDATEETFSGITSGVHFQRDFLKEYMQSQRDNGH